MRQREEVTCEGLHLPALQRKDCVAFEREKGWTGRQELKKESHRMCGHQVRPDEMGRCSEGRGE